MEYTVVHAAIPPSLDGQIHEGPWTTAPAVSVASFHPRNSTHSHKPWVIAKVLYNETGLHVMFNVRDRYVRAIRTGFQDPVCRDACVEFFVQPGEGPGYLNFEISLAGGRLVYWITDCRRIKDKSAKSEFVASEKVKDLHLETLTVKTSKPGPTDPEIEGPLDWWAGFTAPWSFFAAYVPDWKVPGPGTRWRANFYKCADESSHPHWASWAPVGQELNFHQPAMFGDLVFG